MKLMYEPLIFIGWFLINLQPSETVIAWKRLI